MRRQSSSRPPPEHVFFTDRDLGKRVPTALEAAGVEVRRHDDLFPPGTPDTRWLQHVGDEGWVALTHNRSIRYVTIEKDMVIRAGVPLFILIGHYTHNDLASNLVNTLPRVRDFLGTHAPPFIAKVYMASEEDRALGRPGKVVPWWP